jgi:hypothetical protein
MRGGRAGDSRTVFHLIPAFGINFTVRDPSKRGMFHRLRVILGMGIRIDGRDRVGLGKQVVRT